VCELNINIQTQTFHDCLNLVLAVELFEMPNKSWIERTKRLKTEVYALCLAMKDPRVPWYAKLLMALVIGYAISPIDLIPDFIPVIGQIDDLIIVPAGIALVIKMTPKSVMEEYRQKATTEPINTRTKWVVAAIIVSIWVLVIYFVFRLVSPLFFE
jgi:uncharacterized membrane protein YkvA (DUF1232 family)